MSTVKGIYERAKAGDRFVSAVDAAKLVRARLKAEFPEVKFSVRLSSGAWGRSIWVTWEDGPAENLVAGIVKPYGGSGFDGMIDLEYPMESFLTPDGKAFFAQTAGTVGGMGICPAGKAFKPSPEAVRVEFGAKYVLVSRFSSEADEEKAPPTPSDDDGMPF